MSTYAMAGEPGPVTPMPGFAADWRAAVELRRPVTESYAIRYGAPDMDYRERAVSAESADTLLSFYAAEPDLFVITRVWERVDYMVSVSVVGCPYPLVSWLIAL